MNYIQLLQQLLQHPKALKPHIIANTIHDLDLERLHRTGIKYIVFDRDNTLTEHMSEQFMKDRKEEQVVKACQQRFGYDNVALLSNSLLGCRAQKQLNLPVIYTKVKKPLNYSFVVDHFNKSIKAEEICFIGDRLLTDIMLANINGSVGILVEPINTQKETMGIRFVRGLENVYLSSQSQKTQSHKVYGNLD